MSTRTRGLEGTTCRGFGERRGRCENLPGARTVRAGHERVSVPSLCDICDLLRIETGREIARRTGRRPVGMVALEFTRLDRGVRTRVRRAGR